MVGDCIFVVGILQKKLTEKAKGKNHERRGKEEWRGVSQRGPLNINVLCSTTTTLFQQIS